MVFLPRVPDTRTHTRDTLTPRARTHMHTHGHAHTLFHDRAGPTLCSMLSGNSFSWIDDGIIWELVRMMHHSIVFACYPKSGPSTPPKPIPTLQITTPSETSCLPSHSKTCRFRFWPCIV